MEQANWELLTRYALPEPEVYFRCIQYEKDDPSRFEEGLLKLAAKAFVRYGYDLLPAINQLEQDAMDRLRGKYGTGVISYGAAHPEKKEEDPLP